MDIFKTSLITRGNQKGVIGHEMGHVMGLAHVTTSSSLMYDDIAYTSVTAAVAHDLNGINHLYASMTCDVVSSLS
jgi:predicted Zn-dependent protease